MDSTSTPACGVLRALAAAARQVSANLFRMRMTESTKTVVVASACCSAKVALLWNSQWGQTCIIKCSQWPVQGNMPVECHAVQLTPASSAAHIERMCHSNQKRFNETIMTVMPRHCGTRLKPFFGTVDLGLQRSDFIQSRRTPNEEFLFAFAPCRLQVQPTLIVAECAWMYMPCTDAACRAALLALPPSVAQWEFSSVPTALDFTNVERWQASRRAKNALFYRPSSRIVGFLECWTRMRQQSRLTHC